VPRLIDVGLFSSEACKEIPDASKRDDKTPGTLQHDDETPGTLKSESVTPGTLPYDSRYFSYVAAFGSFTNVPYSTAQSAKNIFGQAAYFFEGIMQIANISSIDCEIDIDGEKISGNFTLGIITNATSVAGFKIQPGGDAIAVDDGLFEAIFVRTPVNLTDLSDIIAVLTGASASSELIVQRSAKRITINAAQPFSWTLDGEYGGEHPRGGEHTRVVVENKRRAWRIITPSV